MLVSHTLLFALGSSYLAVLVAIAWLTERIPFLGKVARSPVVHALSLGVFASAWTYYGGYGFTQRHGLVYLTVYLGPTLAALLLPVLGVPLERLLRRERLSSLADLFAFRYRSRSAGLIVVVALVLSSLPYIAQQIRALTESVEVLAGVDEGPIVSIAYCTFLAGFACVFGMRPTGDRTLGLFVALALESVVKVVALALIGVFAVRATFGGPGGLVDWLATHPDVERRLLEPVERDEGFTSLLLLSAGAGILLPRQFYLLFHPTSGPRTLRTSAWIFPATLLALTVPTVPVLLAAQAAHIEGPVDFTSLNVAQRFGAPSVSILTFIGGLSASSAMILVTVLAITELSVTHVVLPAQLSASYVLTEGRIAWIRRGVAVLFVFCGWLVYALASRGPLVEAVIPSFIAVAQFVPGLVGALGWRRATRRGVLLGLAFGLTTWFLTAELPSLLGPTFFVRRALARVWAGNDDWTLPSVLSMAANTIAFVLGSLSAPADRSEAEAAARCMPGEPVAAGSLQVLPQASLATELAGVLGESAAHDLVARARKATGGSAELTRPHELARLRDEVQRELSARVGPIVARIVVDERLRREAAQLALADRLVELEAREHTHGTSGAELLHGVVRGVLDALPLGVAALGPDGAIVMWNAAMERLTKEPGLRVRGMLAAKLPAPWATLVLGEAGEQAVETEAKKKLLVVRRSVLDGAVWGEPGVFGEVVLVEDRTEQRSLEAQIAHGDRLSAIGRFAAGVAHEVGNPLTAIAFLAQNVARDVGGEVGERAKDIVTQTQRIDAIVRSLLRYSRDDAMTDSGRHAVFPVALDRVVAEALTLVALDRSTIRVRTENLVPPDLTPLGRPQELVQIFVNLFTNAFDASPEEGGLILVDGYVEGDCAIVRVVDNGSGIAKDMLERVFEPFFSTKADAGTGLGLFVVRRLVEELGGTVRVESELGAGSTFVLSLPLEETE